MFIGEIYDFHTSSQNIYEGNLISACDTITGANLMEYNY
jgi:hypothetical protein